MIKFSIQECREKGGISTKPASGLNLNLKVLEKKYKTIISTPIAIVVDINGQVVIHKYGELIFKEEKDLKKIEKMAREIYSA